TQWRRHVCSHQFSALIREARAALVRSRPAARSRDAWKDSRHCVTRVATRKSRGPHWLFAPQAYATKRALNGWGAMRNRRGHTAGKRIGWMLAFAAACITPAEASAADTHILRAEPVRSITPDRDVALRKSGPSGLKALRFEAYGRRFDLSLDANRELLGAAQATHAKAQPSSLQLYRGDIEGVAGTWVRLAIKDGVLEGMLWDGVHLYAIEPTERVRASFAPGLDVGAAQSVIFKLADVRIDASEASCAAVKGDAPQTGAQAYESLSQELGGAALLDSADVSMGLKVSTLSDALFFERHGGAQQARDAILVRLNN